MRSLSVQYSAVTIWFGNDQSHIELQSTTEEACELLTEITAVLEYFEKTVKIPLTARKNRND